MSVSIKSNKRINEEKTELMLKTKLNTKLDYIHENMYDYLGGELTINNCPDIPAESQCTVFISISDGRHRANVCHSSAANLENAFLNARHLALDIVKNNKLDPNWVKVDVVDSIMKVPYEKLKEFFLNAKFQKFFRMGFSLDPNMNMAFLEAEANAYKIYDYTVIPMKASQPGHENVPCINVNQITKYLTAQGRKEAVPEIGKNIYVFNCKSFFSDSDKSIYKLYDKGLHLGRRETDELTAEFIKEILVSSSAHLVKQILPNGKFIYGYYPSFNTTMKSYNILRHAGTLWSMMCAYDVIKDDSLIPVINQAIDYMLSQITYKNEDTAYLVEEKAGEIKLGGNGIAVISLSKHMETYGDRDFTDIIKKLANGIIDLQNPESGKFTHVIDASTFEVVEEFRTVYYDGESSYALTKAYEISGDEKYLMTARKAIDYFVENDYVRYRDHWLAYAMNAFTCHVKEEKYYTFALRNAWENRTRIKNQETSYHTYLELLMETYDLYLRMKTEGIHVDYMDVINIDEIIDVIKYRAWHMLDGYFYPEYAMYMSKPDSIIGSFFVRHDGFRVRIDDEQHFIDGYAKFYKLMFD